jgi:hypothetical protein
MPLSSDGNCTVPYVRDGAGDDDGAARNAALDDLKAVGAGELRNLFDVGWICAKTSSEFLMREAWSAP